MPMDSVMMDLGGGAPFRASKELSHGLEQITAPPTKDPSEWANPNAISPIMKGSMRLGRAFSGMEAAGTGAAMTAASPLMWLAEKANLLPSGGAANAVSYAAPMAWEGLKEFNRSINPLATVQYRAPMEADKIWDAYKYQDGVTEGARTAAEISKRFVGQATAMAAMTPLFGGSALARLGGLSKAERAMQDMAAVTQGGRGLLSRVMANGGIPAAADTYMNYIDPAVQAVGDRRYRGMRNYYTSAVTRGSKRLQNELSPLYAGQPDDSGYDAAQWANRMGWSRFLNTGELPPKPVPEILPIQQLSDRIERQVPGVRATPVLDQSVQRLMRQDPSLSPAAATYEALRQFKPESMPTTSFAGE